jgi:hypothetical protein
LVVHGQRLHFGNLPHIPNIVKAEAAESAVLKCRWEISCNDPMATRNLTRFEKVLEIQAAKV